MKKIYLLHPSYQSVFAEFSHLLSRYIVFLGRASLNWVVDWTGLVLFLTGPAHDDNGAQRSIRYLLASGPPVLVIFCLRTSASSFFTESNTQPSSIFLLKRHVLLPFSNLPIVLLVHIHVLLYWKYIKFPFHIYILIFVVVFPPSANFSHNWFSLKPTQLSHVLFAYKNKTIFFGKSISYLKNVLSFRDYKSSDSTETCKIRLNFLTVVLGRKWAVINYLRISKWAANY